jgi:flagellar basal body-associated protein FliL
MTDNQAAEPGPPSGPTALWIAIAVVIVLFMAAAIVVAVIETR